MRNTKQKDLIHNIIVNSFSHLTADDIYKECIKFIPNISLGTVYRNLNNLVNSDKIRRIKMPNNIDRYDKNVIHTHIICKVCGKINDIEYNNLELPKLNTYEVIDYDLYFNGICNDCREKEN